MLAFRTWPSATQFWVTLPLKITRLLPLKSNHLCNKTNVLTRPSLHIALSAAHDLQLCRLQTGMHNAISPLQLFYNNCLITSEHKIKRLPGLNAYKNKFIQHVTSLRFSCSETVDLFEVNERETEGKNSDWCSGSTWRNMTAEGCPTSNQWEVQPQRQTCRTQSLVLWCWWWKWVF